MISYIRATARRDLGPVLLAALLALPIAGCDIDELLDVEDRDVVSGPVFSDPENLPAVYGGAVSEFANAMGGQYNGEGGIILQSGMFADELYNSDNFSDRQAIDARNMTPVNDANETAFYWLQRARNHAEVAVGLLEAGATGEENWLDERAELLGLAGFTYVMFGENYCGGVPFSTIPQDGPTIYGSAETTTQIFDRAMARFDAALALDADPALEMMALVGKARTLLNKAQSAADVTAAAALVSSVPTDFTYTVLYSPAITAAANAVWQLINAERRWSASESEGTNGMPFVSSGDPRTPTTSSPGGGAAPGIPHFSQAKYPTQGSAIPLATGVEARLIEAEAALRNDDRAAFFAIHNALRAGVTGLTPFVDAGQTTPQLVDLHFRERAFWLWLTSHRLGDLRRLVRPTTAGGYGRAAESVYPTGPTVRGDQRGTNVALPVPFGEENNPNYDPSACDINVP